MRACVIFNPTARGDKARHFRRHVDELGAGIALKPTQAPGDGRRLAAEAVREGFDTIVAAGGDGTVNEVLNGLADVPDGFARARFAVLPLGTVNVFARELNLPLNLRAAWATLANGHERRVDAPFAEFNQAGKIQRRYFAQLAGAGLDAHAIARVDWNLKKRIGPLAYGVAGVKAMRGPYPRIVVEANGQMVAGEFVLVGHGRFYGGSVTVFPEARLDDGLLDVCVFPCVNWPLIARYAWGFITGRPLIPQTAQWVRAATATLRAEAAVPFELDGDVCGELPVTLGLQPRALRVLA